MPNIFEAVDPRGYTVVCTEECWKWHILSRHYNMMGEEEAVQKAIEDPSLPIFQDVDYEDRNVYYRRTDRKTLRYLRVIVKFEDELGEVITAFFVDKPKPGERMI